MTLCFQGRHKDKRRITYKRGGDGFQRDSLCENQFMYQVYFCNHPAPPKYINMKISPLYSRVMAPFDSLQDKNHLCGMDYLYTSATLCRKAYTHEKRMMVHGVPGKGMQGIPDVMKQEKVKNRKKQVQLRGTVKAAILQGDKEFPDILASSIYDTKPVHFLSMVCTKINWLDKIRKVYNVDTGLIETMKFLRMNNIDHCNYSMGHVDLSYQQINMYRMNFRIRNWKWWWSYLLWGLGAQIINAYVIYKRLNFQHRIKKEDLILHHYFIKRIAIYWITSGYDNSSSRSHSGKNGPLLSISKGCSTRRIISTTGSTSISVS